MTKRKLPQFLQPTLWSLKVENLDVQKDKIYIINQILVYGGLKELRWLFKTYPKQVIKEVFLHQPLKIYTPTAFNFAKEILLNIRNQSLNFAEYDRNSERVIGS